MINRTATLFSDVVISTWPRELLIREGVVPAKKVDESLTSLMRLLNRFCAPEYDELNVTRMIEQIRRTIVNL